MPVPGRKTAPNFDGLLEAAREDPELRKLRNREACLAVLEDVTRLARRTRSLVVHPGERDVAVRTGMSRGAVQNALAALTRLGYVERAGDRRRRTSAAEWRLCPRAKPGHNSRREQSRTRTRGAILASDLWRYQYLGKKAHAIYGYVAEYSDWSPDFADIHKQVGGDKRTVKKHLGVLVGHGLLAGDSDGYTLGPRSVEDVEAEFGLSTYPVTVAQHRRNRADQAYFREAVALAESRCRSLVPGYAVQGRSVVPVAPDSDLDPLGGTTPDTSRPTTGTRASWTLANGRSAQGPGWRVSAWLGTRPRLAPHRPRPRSWPSWPPASCRRPHGPPGARPP